MVFALTEEQGMIRDMAQNFADEKMNIHFLHFLQICRLKAKV